MFFVPYCLTIILSHRLSDWHKIFAYQSIFHPTRVSLVSRISNKFHWSLYHLMTLASNLIHDCCFFRLIVLWYHLEKNQLCHWHGFPDDISSIFILYDDFVFNSTLFIYIILFKGIEIGFKFWIELWINFWKKKIFR